MPGELIVVLVNTRNPLNIGAAARAMSNFGFARLRVVNPYEPSWREARSAVGASAILQTAEQFTSLAGAVADCALVVGTTTSSNRELQQPLVALPAAAPRMRKAMASGPVALLFGSEKRGLSNADLSYCQWLLRIPTREEHPSMNLGQAVAVCLYEVARASKVAAGERLRAARGGDLDRLTALLLDLLRESGYFSSESAAANEKVRRLVRRLKLEERDAATLLGMLRQVEWKIKNK